MEFSNLRVYQPDGTFKTGGLSISGDRIASAEVSADAVDMGGLYAVPGLVDLHFHGCMGRDFCDGTHEAISTLAKYQAQIGVAAICPAAAVLPLAARPSSPALTVRISTVTSLILTVQCAAVPCTRHRSARR